MDYAALIKKQFGKELKLFRQDNKLTLDKKFDRFIFEKGVVNAPSAPYIPAQNGNTERAEGVIIIKAKCIVTTA